jgi:hypothetical protein
MTPAERFARQVLWMFKRNTSKTLAAAKQLAPNAFASMIRDIKTFEAEQSKR